MGREYFGKCAICGKEGKLSYEHIPPQKAFNWLPVKYYSSDDFIKHVSSDRLPWDFSEMTQYDPHQKGCGEYTLCQDCNNNTGSWFGSDYVSFAETIHNEIIKNMPKNKERIRINCRMFPLRILKQVSSMFCSVNRSNDGEVINLLRDFVQNKTVQSFPCAKAKIGMHGFIGGLPKQWGISAMSSNMGNGNAHIDIFSVIYHYPLGFVLFFEPDDNTIIPGIDISTFNAYTYDQEVMMDFDLPCFEAYTLFPLDYRTQNEVIRDRINAKLKQQRYKRQ